MIDPVDALGALTRAGIHFFTGVPDSLLKDLNACIADRVDDTRHVVAHNEGGAVALAAGHYLATGRPGLVYMQNSGLGNAVNPLVSLASEEVYGIPMVLMIGWRGQPGRKDEPQHAHQGRVTEDMLALLDIPVYHLSESTVAWEEVLSSAVDEARQSMCPTAVLVAAKTFSKYSGTTPAPERRRPRRMEALQRVLRRMPGETCFVATTGYTARELAALRADAGGKGDRDFLGVGSMGHAASVALGLALSRPELDIVCLDGDGSLGMHMGVMAMIGDLGPSNLGHILFNNRVHESVGGQPTALKASDPIGIAGACGYGYAVSCETLDDLDRALGEAVEAGGPWFVEVQISPGTLDDLPRPDGFHSRLGLFRQSLST